MAGHATANGQTRAKNGKTRIDSLREIYGDNFGEGIRGDVHLSTLSERTGYSSPYLNIYVTISTSQGTVRLP
jgi:hypothetical protein